MGMDDKTIISLALALNNQNDPPKTEKEITKIVKKLIEKSEHLEGNFWTINRSNIKIHTGQFIDFLSNNGFAKVYYDKSYIYVKIDGKIADEVIIANIKDFILSFLTTLADEMSYYKESIREIILDKVNKYFADTLLATLKAEKLDMKNGDKETGFIYYNNGYVTCKKNAELQLKSYATLDKPIWKSRKLDRDFDHKPIKYNLSEFERFLINVARNNEERFFALCSSIGYLLHGFKNKSTARAIITVDEKISDNPNGGTGKSLFGNAISQIKQSVRIDSKNFVFREAFTFQQLDISSEILEFNDAQKNFNFEKLFSVITDDMSIEYKSQTPIKIPFEESPKILISTNATISGSGSSYKRRMFELEFSDYYNETHQPIHDFGHNFFEDWDKEEWNRFDNFMLECLMLYLDEGLMDYKKINLLQRKLISDTSKDFIEFIDSYLVLGVEHNKRLFYEAFSNHISYEVYDCPIKKPTVTSWVETYANYKEYKYASRESNGQYYFKITN